MTGFFRASGATGAAVLALCASASFASTGEDTANSSALIAVSSQAAIQLTAQAPATLAATTPALPPVVQAPPVSAVPPAPVQTAAAVQPAPAPQPAKPATRGFSAFFPKFLPTSVANTVAAVKAIPGALGGLVGKFRSTATQDEEHECLATAVYFESKGEPLEGQLAVAQVVMNRASSGRYPSSLCGVVKQRSQFSFVRRGQLPQPPKSSEAWQRAVAVAKIARERLASSVAGNALSFHATYVAPGWGRNLTRIARIGAHIFYR